VIDLDYLVVVEDENAESSELLEYLDLLRATLLAGSTAARLDLVPSDLKTSIDELCAAFSSDSVAILPAFTFGPFPMPRNPGRDLTVFLHINGPIPTNGLRRFCTLLPFHGTSIISNHQLVCGSMPDVCSEAIVSREVLSPWLRGLALRVRSNNEPSDIAKAIRKLCHMTCLASGCPSNDPRVYLPFFSQLHGVPPEKMRALEFSSREGNVLLLRKQFQYFLSQVIEVQGPAMA
jgi:hypothetical protein